MALLVFLSFAACAHCKAIWRNKLAGLRRIRSGNIHCFVSFCVSSTINVKHPVGFPFSALRQYLRQIDPPALPVQVWKLLFSVFGNPDQSHAWLLLSHLVQSFFLFPCSRLTYVQNRKFRKRTVLCSDSTSPPVLQDAIDSSTFRERSGKEEGAKCDLVSSVWTSFLATECLLSPWKSPKAGLFFLWGTVVGSLKDILHDHVQTSKPCPMHSG